LAPHISRVERRIAVALPRSGLGRLNWQRLLLGTVQWPTSAGLAKSGAPTSEQPDPDPAGAWYIWASDQRSLKSELNLSGSALPKS